jgi:hypothetical protein
LIIEFSVEPGNGDVYPLGLRDNPHDQKGTVDKGVSLFSFPFSFPWTQFTIYLHPANSPVATSWYPDTYNDSIWIRSF